MSQIEQLKEPEQFSELVAEMKGYCDRHNLMEEDFLYMTGLMRRALLAASSASQRLSEEQVALACEALRYYKRTNGTPGTAFWDNCASAATAIAALGAGEGQGQRGICGECLKPVRDCICLRTGGIRCGACGADLSNYPTSASAHICRAAPPAKGTQPNEKG